MVTIELTDVERKQCIELFDIALRQLGLNQASLIYNLALKFNSAPDQEEKTEDSVA